MKFPFIPLAAALAFASCAAPKAVVVEVAPKKKTPAVATAAPETPAALADDGFRFPDDMLSLPEDSQLRSTAPIKRDGNGTIITSPPSD